MNKIDSYLKFELIEQKLKTGVYLISSIKTDTILGRVYWYNSWRRYAFFPEENSVFDSSCLGEIKVFIDSLMKKRSERGDF